MKKVLLPAVLVFLFVAKASAQLIADAGYGGVLCPDSVRWFGGSPTALGGTPPYTYSWAPVVGLSAANIANPVVSGNVAAQYVLTVTDSVGNIARDTVHITVSGISVTPSVTNVTCYGGNNGAIQLSVNSVYPVIHYYWYPNHPDTSNLSGLTAGTYNLYVQDSLHCYRNIPVIITQPNPIQINAYGTHQGSCNDTAYANPTGGTAPYTYQWSTGATTSKIINTCYGIYSVTVTDSHNCTATAIVIDSSNNCFISPINLTIQSTNITCAHLSDTLMAVASGGASPYSYWWSNAVSTANNIVLQAGNYHLSVVDNAGCYATTNKAVLYQGLTIAVAENRPSCNGTNNGKVKVNVSGGAVPYTYQWNNGATADSLINTSAGNYIVTATDVNSCTGIKSVSILSDYMIATVNPTPAVCTYNGTATVNIIQSFGTGIFVWNTVPPQFTQTATGLAPGTYSVTITDSIGCKLVKNGTVTSTCYNLIKGNIFNDINGNCLKDSGENFIANVPVTATTGNYILYGYSNYQGHYQIIDTVLGSFSVFANANAYGNCINFIPCDTQQINFNALGDTAVVNIGMSSSGSSDLAIHPGWSFPGTGNHKHFWAYYYQLSPVLYTGNATIVYKYNPILQFQSATPGGVNDAVAHTVTWTVSNVPYGAQYNPANRVDVDFIFPINLSPLYMDTVNFTIYPTATDCDPVNNHFVSLQPLFSSHDPNEKVNEPAGDIYDADSIITYTIHFQNTGTDTARFVLIRYTLSQYLEPATAVTMASSHPYSKFDITGHGVLTWLFFPIYLPDSNANVEGSKGFVTFRIKRKPNLPVNTEIKNSAGIYFDYNQAVITNTTINTIANKTGIPQIHNQYSEFRIYPNPATTLITITIDESLVGSTATITDITGRRVAAVNLTTQYLLLNTESFANGIYFVTINNTTRKLIISK